MKKAAVLIFTVILSVFCSASVFAAESDLAEERTISVFAKAAYTLPDGCYGAEADDGGGDYVVKLPDGSKITLTPKSAVPSLRVVIVPITENDKQAYQWVSSRTTDFGTDPLFYDIYFINEYGTRVDVNMTLEVNIELINGYNPLKAAEISTDGTVSRLVSKNGGNKISFTIEKGGYYAVASASGDNTDKSVSPETGTTDIPEMWFALLFVCAAVAVGAAIYGRKNILQNNAGPKSET